MSRIALPLIIAICLMACACSDGSNSRSTPAEEDTIAPVWESVGATPLFAATNDHAWVLGREWHYDPAGNRYIMQSFSRIVDPDLAQEDLAGLAGRLALPEGWEFYSEVLDAPLQVPGADGIAEVLTDDLRNTYQRMP